MLVRRGLCSPLLTIVLSLYLRINTVTLDHGHITVLSLGKLTGKFGANYDLPPKLLRGNAISKLISEVV